MSDTTVHRHITHQLVADMTIHYMIRVALSHLDMNLNVMEAVATQVFRNRHGFVLTSPSDL